MQFVSSDLMSVLSRQKFLQDTKEILPWVNTLPYAPLADSDVHASAIEKERAAKRDPKLEV